MVKGTGLTEKPIIFSAPMVRALLEGRKTQTRRGLKPQPPRGDHFGRDIMDWGLSGIYRDDLNTSPSRWWLDVQTDVDDNSHREIDVRYGAGDRLWVREAHTLLPRLAYRGSIGTGTIDQREHPTDGYTAAVFREGFDRSGRPRWRPSIHMPRWASRLTLVVTEVRVERLQDISEADAQAEGVEALPNGSPIIGNPFGVRLGDHVFCSGETASKAFQTLWQTIHGAGAWDANPWVAAITFEVHRANIDALEAGRAALAERGGAE